MVKLLTFLFLCLVGLTALLATQLSRCAAVEVPPFPLYVKEVSR